MKTIIFVFSVIFVFLTVRSYAGIDSGLVAYYSFSGNYDDQSGNSHHGTSVNQPVFVHDRFSRPNSAVYLSGDTDYVSLPASIQIVRDISISFWVKTTASDPQPFYEGMFLIDRDVCNWRRDWDITMGSGGKVIFVTGTDFGDHQTPTSMDLNDGYWHHITVTLSSADSMKRIYVDRILNRKARFVPAPYVNNNLPIYVGASVCGPLGHDFFEGAVDDIRFYNRAITQSEVNALYFGDTSYVRIIPQGLYDSLNNVLTKRDTIDIYFHKYYSILDSVRAVIDTTTFMAPFTVADKTGELMFIEVRMRNSLHAISDIFYVDFPTVVYDFTSRDWTNGRMLTKVDNAPARYACFSGDVNQDNSIDATDAALVENDARNLVTGYSVTDLNGDGIVDASDFAIVDVNVFKMISLPIYDLPFSGLRQYIQSE